MRSRSPLVNVSEIVLREKKYIVAFIWGQTRSTNLKEIEVKSPHIYFTPRIKRNLTYVTSTCINTHKNKKSDFSSELFVKSISNSLTFLKNKIEEFLKVNCFHFIIFFILQYIISYIFSYFLLLLLF